MTPPVVPEPTLLELLEEAAVSFDFEAAKRRTKTGQNDAGRVLDGAMGLVAERRAARLRAAATRLREFLDAASANEMNRCCVFQVSRINNGPLPPTKEPTRP